MNSGKIKKLCLGGAVFLSFFLLPWAPGKGWEIKASEYREEWEEGGEYKEIQETLEEEQKDLPSFQGLVERLRKGEEKPSFSGFLRWMQKTIGGIFQEEKGEITALLFIGLLAGILLEITGLFSQGIAASMGKQVILLGMLSVCYQVFSQCLLLTEHTLSALLSFMEALIPTYFLAMACGSGSVAAASFYEFTLLMLGVANFLLLQVILPCIRWYFLLGTADILTGQKLLGRFAALLSKGISWALKGMIGVVAGFQTVQGMLLPITGQVRRSMILKGLGMIPGIGGTAKGAAETILGSGILLKSAIGVAGVLTLFLLAGAPLLKVGFLALCVKGGEILVGPMGEGESAEAANGMFGGVFLLFQTLLAGTVLFFLAIAISGMATNQIW